MKKKGKNKKINPIIVGVVIGALVGSFFGFILLETGLTGKITGAVTNSNAIFKKVTTRLIEGKNSYDDRAGDLFLQYTDGSRKVQIGRSGTEPNLDPKPSNLIVYGDTFLKKTQDGQGGNLDIEGKLDLGLYVRICDDSYFCSCDSPDDQVITGSAMCAKDSFLYISGFITYIFNESDQWRATCVKNIPLAGYVDFPPEEIAVLCAENLKPASNLVRR